MQSEVMEHFPAVLETVIKTERPGFIEQKMKYELATLVTAILMVADRTDRRLAQINNKLASIDRSLQRGLVPDDD